MIKKLLNCIFIFLTLFIVLSYDVKALSFDTFNVTWYYRNKSNESNLLNVTKSQDQKLYAATDEYVNGYTTRLETNFIKDAQYYITYELKLFFSPEQELYYRSDTLDRIKNYSYVDSDFKLLNVTTTEEWNRSVSSGPTLLTIKVVMQVIALENTSAVRFGVYTTDNISIGFYSHTEQIDYYLLDNISIDEDINAVIIDKNNQILSGQEELKGDISNSTNTITGEINDMEQSIIDSNKETQETIKDQFNDCRDSYNLLDLNNVINGGGNNITANIINSNSISFSMNTSGTSAYRQYMLYNPINTFIGKTIYSKFKVDNNFGRLYLGLFDSNYNRIGNLNSGSISIPQNTEATYLGIVFYPCYGNNCQNQTITFSEIMISEQNISFEPYGEEICSNRIDETNDKLDNISGALTDDSPTDMSGLGDSAGWLPAGPVDSILTLPLTMLNNLVTNLSNNSCQTISVELPFVNKNITLPCVRSLYDKIGVTGTLFTTAGLIASAFILFNYLLALYKWVDDTLTMRENTMPGYFDDNWGGGA